MKCQILFPGKIKKNISECLLLKTLLRVLSINSNYIYEVKINKHMSNTQTHYHFIHVFTINGLCKVTVADPSPPQTSSPHVSVNSAGQTIHMK